MNTLFNTLYPLLLFAFVSCSHHKPQAVQDSANGAFLVTAEPKKGPIENSDFGLLVEVKNRSNSVQEFWSKCESVDNWILDTEVFTANPAFCYKTVPHKIKLLPGETWKSILFLSLKNKSEKLPLSFRVGFLPWGSETDMQSWLAGDLSVEKKTGIAWSQGTILK